MARILVIDDEAGVRTILEHTLKTSGHEVVLAASGKEGIDRHRQTPVDVAIIDLFMPDQDGLTTISQFRREFPDVGIIAISGYDTSGAMLTVAREIGALRILDKPFEVKMILALIEDVLRTKTAPTK